MLQKKTFFDKKKSSGIDEGHTKFQWFPWGVFFLFLAEFSRLQCAQSSQSSM